MKESIVKALKRYVINVLVLSLFLSVVPAFGNDVDQNISTEVKQALVNQADQLEAAKKEEKPLSTEKAEESGKISSASQLLNVCGDRKDSGDGKGKGECLNIMSYLLVFYLFALLLGRVFWVVMPNNEYLKTHANLIQVRLDVENDLKDSDPKKKKIDAIEEYLAKVRDRLEGSTWKWVVAFTGKQMSAWRSLHEADRLAIDFYSPDVIKDQANLTLDKLRKTPSTTTTLESQLQKRLEENENNLKELVKEAKAVIYRDDDTQFELLADAQNKALWLVLATAMILLGLSWIFPEAQVLFLAGATGGLLIRLRKVVKTRALPFDYGVSWTVLFLTPLVGALTGWAGTLIFVLLQSWGLVGDGFTVISITNPTFATLMVAIVFGFSATLFEKFAEHLEETVSKK